MRKWNEKNRIRILPHELNKEFGSKFQESYQMQQQTREEGRRI